MARGWRSSQPACHYYAAVFDRLYGRLVTPGGRVREIECEAAGAAACLFEVGWD